MEDRRQFIKKITSLFSGITILSGILPPFLKSLFGKESNILLSGGYMDRDSLKAVSQNDIASRRVHVTPLRSFGVMGVTDIKVAKDEWNLEIKSREGNLIKYSYDDILRLPPVEKEVVLTCPGFFENYGLWKGFSLGSLLREKGAAEKINKVEISGLNGRKDISYKFPLKSVLNDRVFLAYGVNRETLPMRNGFPLRAVAQGYYGSHWIKYVNRVTMV